MFRRLIYLEFKGRLHKNEKEWEFTTLMILTIACCWKPLYTQTLVHICGAWTSFSLCMLEKKDLRKGSANGMARNRISNSGNMVPLRPAS